jgi:hypothetical protein
MSSPLASAYAPVPPVTAALISGGDCRGGGEYDPLCFIWISEVRIGDPRSKLRASDRAVIASQRSTGVTEAGYGLAGTSERVAIFGGRRERRASAPKAASEEILSVAN